MAEKMLQITKEEIISILKGSIRIPRIRMRLKCSDEMQVFVDNQRIINDFKRDEIENLIIIKTKESL